MGLTLQRVDRDTPIPSYQIAVVPLNPGGGLADVYDEELIAQFIEEVIADITIIDCKPTKSRRMCIGDWSFTHGGRKKGRNLRRELARLPYSKTCAVTGNSYKRAAKQNIFRSIFSKAYLWEIILSEFMEYLMLRPKKLFLSILTFDSLNFCYFQFSIFHKI